MKEKADILVVDDTLESLRMVVDVLQEEGYLVRPASSGEMALTALAACVPDLVLLDVLMPGMDGFEVCRRIKAEERTRDVPVIFLSASVERQERVQGFKAGAVDFILKPFQRDELLARIGVHLEVCALRRHLEEVVQLRTEELQRSTERLQVATRAANIGIWDWDVVKNELVWDDPMYRLYSVRREDFGGAYEAWSRHILPEDKARTEGEIQAALRGEREYAPEFRIAWPDGTIRHIKAQSQTFRNPEGKALRMVGTNIDITDLRQAEKELIEKERLHRTILQTAMDGFWLMDDHGRILEANDAYCRMSGYSAQELAAMSVFDLDVTLSPEDIAARVKEVMGQGGIRFETRHRRKDGGTFDIQVSAQSLACDGGRVAIFMQDITERKRSEAEREKLRGELIQSQKMESVGRLAGGVAHDFNNLLTAIGGYTGFLLKGVATDDPRREDINEVLFAVERATSLTKQLLAFSRKQVLSPKVVDLNASVLSMSHMLRRLIGEDVRLETRLSAQDCPITIDPGQLDQLLVNFAVNSRDAMPGGGALVLETAVVTPEKDFSSRHPELPAGPLVRLLISDTGCGMTEDVKSHLFEPFFTTKERGRGTGLGLATVYGIVKQSGGEIEVETAEGRGTTFSMYFPFVTDAGIEKEAGTAGSGENLVMGTGTVLAVDDDETLRRLVGRILADCGYTVVLAADAKEAVEAAGRLPGPLDLLLTDVVLPGRNGLDLARELCGRKLVGRRLYMSGYPGDAIVKHGVLEPGIAFIYKPFTAEALSAKVREVLQAQEGQNKT